MQGQWAEYKTLYNSCMETFCQANGISFGEIASMAIQIVEVSGTGVTLKLITVLANGTASHQGILVDVSTGASNATILGTRTDYFVLAGRLNATDKIWNTPSAPTLNRTRAETVLGFSRMVNFLNYTSSYSPIGFPISISTGFAFDQQSGVLIEFSFSASYNSSVASYQAAFAMGMVDNNIWRNSTLPDFTISANPTALNATQDSPGVSNITITRLNGLTTSVKLTASPQMSRGLGVTCSFSSSTLSSGSSDRSTLSCTGYQGTYTIAVTGDSGYETHTTLVMVNIAANENPDLIPTGLPPSNFTMLLIYAGIAVVAIIAVLVAYFLLRRKTAQPPIAPTSTTTPPPAA